MRCNLIAWMALAWFVAVVPAPAANAFVLVVDAGHGGKDVGAPGAYSYEKNINLKVALAFGRMVEERCGDVKVVYTRKKDVFLPLYERAEIANRNKADLFVSIHTNALEKGKQMRGFESYTLGDGRSHATQTNLEVARRENAVIQLEDDYEQRYVGYDPNSPESNIMFEFVQDKNMERSVDFASMAQRNVCAAADRPDRGVHQTNLAVLRLASMPACLVELGYITTPSEEKLLNDDVQLNRIVTGLYNAFVEYKNKHYDGIEAPKIDVKQPQKEPATHVESAADAPPPPPPPAAEEASMPASQPVFKVQIFVSKTKRDAGDSAFKGLTGCECYEDGALYKYTYGASADYNAIVRTRKEILRLFPEAFIIAFKDGKRVDVNAAISEFKQQRQQ